MRFDFAVLLSQRKQFIAEISPSKLRGALTGFIEVSLTIGIIYGYAVGMWLYEAFPTGYSWKYTFKFATIFGVGMFFGMLYLPESPRWLVSAGRPLYEALEAAQFINSDLTSDEIVNMKKEIERQVPTHLRDRGDASLEGVEAKESPARRLFCSATMRIPMIVGMGLIIGQQVTGLPAMLYYCVDIFAAVSQPFPPVLAFSSWRLKYYTIYLLGCFGQIHVGTWELRCGEASWFNSCYDLY